MGVTIAVDAELLITLGSGQGAANTGRGMSSRTKNNFLKLDNTAQPAAPRIHQDFR